jgi:hypothetical protein
MHQMLRWFLGQKLTCIKHSVGFLVCSERLASCMGRQMCSDVPLLSVPGAHQTPPFLPFVILLYY